MKIIFSKNDSKEINDAIEKIEIFQLETFLNVIGEKGKIESGPNYYLEKMYENSKYNTGKPVYHHIHQKYKRNYAPNEKKKVNNMSYVLFVLSVIFMFSAIFTDCFDMLPTLPDDVIDYSIIPTLVKILFAIGILFLIGFIVPKIIDIYYTKCVKTCYEIGAESELKYPDIYEMLYKLEKSKQELKDISRIVKLSNELEDLCKYGATPKFRIYNNELWVKCEGIETSINDITSFKTKGHNTSIKDFSGEYVENTFRPDVVDFSWLDGKATSDLLSIAEICKDYEIPFNNVNQLETHDTCEGECECEIIQ